MLGGLEGEAKKKRKWDEGPVPSPGGERSCGGCPSSSVAGMSSSCGEQEARSVVDGRKWEDGWRTRWNSGEGRV